MLGAGHNAIVTAHDAGKLVVLVRNAVKIVHKELQAQLKQIDSAQAASEGANFPKYN